MIYKPINLYFDANGDFYQISDSTSLYRFSNVNLIRLITPKTFQLPMSICFLTDVGVSIESKPMTPDGTESVEYPLGSGEYEDWNVWKYVVPNVVTSTVAIFKASTIQVSFVQKEIINEGLANEYVSGDTFGLYELAVSPTVEVPNGDVGDATVADGLQSQISELYAITSKLAKEDLPAFTVFETTGVIEVRWNGGNYGVTLAQIIEQANGQFNWVLTDDQTSESVTFQYESDNPSGNAVKIKYGTASGSVELALGQENWVHGYNVSGANILDGKAVSIVGSQGQRPTIELATNTDDNIAHKTIGVATQDIDNLGYGKVTTFGLVQNLNIGSGFSEGDVVYLGTNGDFVSTKPTEPTPCVEMGIVLKVSGGAIQTLFVTVDKTHKLGAISDVDTTGGVTGDVLTLQADKVWRPQASGGVPEGTYLSRQVQNGAFKETFDFRYNMTTSLMELTNPSGNSLTQQFSDGNTSLDVTTPITIAPTFGTTTVPQKNYFYILQTNKGVIEKSTSGYPSVEHIKIADCTFLDEAYTDTEGPLQNQNHNNHEKGTDEIGALQHIRNRIRSLGAQWDSGVAGATSGSYVKDTAGTLYYTSTAGQVWQMHLQSYSAKDTSVSDDMHVVNDFTTPYREITTFNELTAYSDGTAIGNDFFNVFVYGIVNKGGEYSPVMVNVPSGGYNNISDANADLDQTLDTTVPTEFRRTAFPIVRLVFQKTGTSYSLQNSFDLREQRFGIGGTSGTGVLDGEFIDTTFVLENITDNTKKLQFSASGITTGTTRTLTAQDKDYVVGDKADIDTNATNISTNTSDILTKADKEPNINLQTGLTYTLALTDSDKFLEVNNATSCAITVPTNASVAFPIGTQITIVAIGAGAYTVVGDTGVTINGDVAPTKTITAQYDSVALYKRGTDEWIIVGSFS